MCGFRGITTIFSVDMGMVLGLKCSSPGSPAAAAPSPCSSVYISIILDVINVYKVYKNYINAFVSLWTVIIFINLRRNCVEL